MIGRSLITATVKKNIPKPQKLGKLQGRWERDTEEQAIEMLFRSVTSGEVIALDSQSIMIKVTADLHTSLHAPPRTWCMRVANPPPTSRWVLAPDQVPTARDCLMRRAPWLLSGPTGTGPSSSPSHPPSTSSPCPGSPSGTRYLDCTGVTIPWIT